MQAPTMDKPVFLEGLQSSDVAAFMARGRTRQFRAGELIITGGERATTLFLLCSGQVKYYRLTRGGDEVLLRLLIPGEIFGLGTLLRNPLPYMGSADAVSQCDIVTWEHKSVVELADKYPQLAQNALRIVLGYLTKYADRHVGMVSRTAEQRLAHTLLRLGKEHGRAKPHGIEVDATNEHLGGLSDMSLFTASRLLAEWRRQGTVGKQRGKVLIRVPEALLVD
ncbi:MAG: Crp/Fnr family transcriptional regulator [Verrucomicrobiales bacterium]|nr:Crp/Fnr family transcriptional regulator [Verrucomicrobiales bacterium]